MAGTGIHVQVYPSPCGSLLLAGYGGRLCLCEWSAEARSSRLIQRLQRATGAATTPQDYPVLQQARAELDAYFAGTRREFSLPLLFIGTEFQRRVWRHLLHLGYGQTTSYGELARQLGRPGAARAVARAVGANALSVVVSCHRVLGCGGRLTGYSGGLDAKRYLLELERHLLL